MSLYKGNNLISGAMPNSANQSLSNLDTTGQAVIDGKVSKSGDTMTGVLNLDMTTVGSNNENFQDVTFSLDDINRAGIRCSHSTDGTNSVQVIVRNNSGTFASGYEARNNNGTLSCSFPNTTCVDGQWVASYYKCVSGLSTDTDKTYSLSSYLPNDNYNYEVLFQLSGRTTTAQGSYVNYYLYTDAFSQSTLVAATRAVTAAYMACGGNIILPVGTGRSVTLHVGTGTSGENITIEAKGYRRMGTNR